MNWTDLWFIVWGLAIGLLVQIIYDWLGDKYKDKPTAKRMAGIFLFCIIVAVLIIWALIEVILTHATI